MAFSIFDDKSRVPGEDDLRDVLKGTFPLWNDIKAFVYKNYPEAHEEWKYAGKTLGWGFRLRDKKRVIVYLTPANGFFRFSLVFSEKATNEAFSSAISQQLKDILTSARVYAEGRGFRVEVTTGEFMEDFKKLILIKLAN